MAGENPQRRYESPMNWLRTAILMAGLTGFFLAVGFLLGGPEGALIALVLAAGMNLFAYWNSDQLLLRMHHAREVGPREAPQLFAMVEQLARKAGLPMPRLYIIEEDQPNAFATGRSPDHAAVAVTRGLLQRLDQEEVAGVMAHELAHVDNRDTLIMTVTATIAGAVSMLANFALFFGGNRNNPLGLIGTVLLMILAPVAAMLVQSAISRTREFAADARGAEICGNPLWLASALAKLERGAQRIDNPVAEANPASAHLFIVNPLHAHRIDSLFSTHPPMDERIRRLRAQAGAAGRRPSAQSPWG